MDLSFSSLFCGIIFSSVGVGYFIYGKKQQEIWFMAAGLGLMFFPYFVGGAGLLLLIGSLLGALPFAAARWFND